VIVISGALVLVALVLLVLGLALRELDYVYGSIAVSLVSFVFLIIGVLQRRGDDAYLDVPDEDDDKAPQAAGSLPHAAPAVAASDPPAGTAGPPPGTAGPPPGTAGAAGAGEPAGPGSEPLVLPDSAPPSWPATPPGDVDATVVVIPQRSRFHVPQCRFVRGVVGTEQLTRSEADGQGYVPCGVCRP
jgi:hypothetical protein